MTHMALSEVAVIHGGGRLGLTGKDFVDGGVPAYGAAGLNGLVDQAEYDRDAIVLSSIGARCGKCFLAEGQWTSLANTQVILPDESKVDSRFLWHQLNDEDRWPRSGSAQPFIKPSDVKKHQIWLPPLEEQRRIAAILDQADHLLAQRQRSVEKTYSLEQSIFLEKFGDPRTNEQPWETRSFAECVQDSTSQCPRVPRSRFLEEGRYPVVDQGQEFIAGYVDDEELVCPIREPVVCFGDHTRTVKLVDFEFVVGADGLKVLTTREGVDPVYFSSLLRLRPVPSLGYSRHMRELKRMHFPIPPLHLQLTFAQRLALVSTHRERLNSASASHRDLSTSVRRMLMRVER